MSKPMLPIAKHLSERKTSPSGYQSTWCLQAEGRREAYLAAPRFPHSSWGLALLPLNQGSVTGDKSKSWPGRQFVSTPQTACIAAGNYLSHLDHFWYLSLFKPEYNRLGLSACKKSRVKKRDTEEKDVKRTNKTKSRCLALLWSSTLNNTVGSAKCESQHSGRRICTLLRRK